MTRQYDLRRYPHPGKFEGGLMIDEYAYGVSLDGGADDEANFGDGNGWYGLLRHGHTIFRDHDPFLEQLTEDEAAFVKQAAGCIIHEDNQGFVSVTWYMADEQAKMDEDWNAIVDEMDDDDADDE